MKTLFGLGLGGFAFLAILQANGIVTGVAGLDQAVTKFMAILGVG
jgi:hypothetical protein